MAHAKLLLAALVFLAACGGKPPASKGEALFQALNCRACHRVGELGSRSGGPDLTTVGFRHSRDWIDAFLKDPQAWKPGTLMPNPRLSDDARRELAGYLAGLKGQDWKERPWNAASLKSDPIKRGRVLYAKAGCIACHGRGGMGGYPNNNVAGGKITGLTHVRDSFTPDELAKKIRSGVKPQKADPKGPEPSVFMPPWGEFFSDEEISAAAAYLLALKPEGAPSDW